PIGSSGKSGGQGSITLSTVTLGGTSRGSHTTNFAEDLTMLFLEAEEDVMLREDMAFRIYGNISDALLMKACNLAKLVKGKIKFVSDETVIAQQLNEGRPIDVARDYALTGCFLHTVPGITHDPGGDFFCLPMMLELALNNGVCRYNNKRFGPETGDPRKFNTYEDVWNAYTEQIRALLPVSISGQNLTFKLSGEMLPSPLMSALYDGCIESGRDVVNCGGKYNSVSLWVSGIPSVADSLAALKKTVFEDHVLTMDEVITAIENDFVGYENVQKILSSAPKYGNDIDYVDYIVNDVISFMADEIKQYKAPYGRQWTCAGAAITSNVSLGRVVAAMPDGRKAGEPYSEGGMSPFQGRNVSGVTSTLVSAAKVNLTKATGGSVVNLKINPDGMNDKMKMWKFANLLRTACQMGLDIVQFNFISNEVLREAQAHPENYRDLLVRVATYSAYFVGLPLDVQNEIISRTEFEGI
ncbi:MAG: hypothetical protein LUH07_12510, partial [Lachnospiraceae bacterium]|nr:hypothetical protein [Lachnospiraceae bacterium]